MKVRSVVVLNDFCHVQGGASGVAINEAVALAALGLDVTFIGAVGPICGELRAAPVKVLCLDQPELAGAVQHPGVALQALWNPAAYRTLRLQLATLDPRQTIVHLHGYTKALTTAPALAASRAGFPVICTLHDFFSACPNGAFYNYRRQIPCLLPALSMSCMLAACDKRHGLHKAYRVVRGLAQRSLSRFPSSVRDYITLSRRSAELLGPYLPTDARFHTLPNIINVARRSPVNVAGNEQMIVIGRLDAEKGVDLAAEACNAIGLPLVFVGDGPRRAYLESMGAHVTGWLTADKVQQHLARARCLVFPSRWYETYGLVVSEAAARGVPAIVSDVTAPAERIVDGVAGWAFRSGDLDSLMHCMRQTRDDALVSAAGTVAYRQYWQAPSDPRSHALMLLSIYDTVISCSRPAFLRTSAA
jgi:glycosyltransferase involved in cell wall biosynthesis